MITHYTHVHCSICWHYLLVFAQLDIPPALNRPRQPLSFESTIFIFRNNEAVFQSHADAIDTIHGLPIYRQIDSRLKTKHMSGSDLPFAQRPLYQVWGLVPFYSNTMAQTMGEDVEIRDIGAGC